MRCASTPLERRLEPGTILGFEELLNGARRKSRVDARSSHDARIFLLLSCPAARGAVRPNPAVPQYRMVKLGFLRSSQLLVQP